MKLILAIVNNEDTARATDALMNIAEPVFNLSMLDGVNSLLSSLL